MPRNRVALEDVDNKHPDYAVDANPEDKVVEVEGGKSFKIVNAGAAKGWKIVQQGGGVMPRILRGHFTRHAQAETALNTYIVNK